MEIKCNGDTINILEYLPIQRKYALIETTIQEAEDVRGYIHPLLVDMFFGLNIVYLYTDIKFTQEEKDEPEKLFDKLNQEGILAQVFSAINEDELSDLKAWLYETIAKREEANRHLGTALRGVLEDMPRYGELIQEQLNSFDKDKFKEVIDFVKAANNGKMPN